MFLEWHLSLHLTSFPCCCCWKKKHVNCITPAYVKFKQKRRDYAATSPPLLSCVLYKRSSARRLISIPYLYIVHIAQCMEQL
jgi:hypothetical protein